MTRAMDLRVLLSVVVHQKDLGPRSNFNPRRAARARATGRPYRTLPRAT